MSLSARRSPVPGPRRRRRGASDEVALEIRRHIQVQRLGPGEFLGREEDLAAEFGVSRPTLREALKVLAGGNLIRAAKGPGGGIFVENSAEDGISRSLSDAIQVMLETGAVSLEELLDARLLLEVPLAGLAASNADAAAIEALRQAIAEHSALAEEQAASAADARVHRALAAAGGNQMIVALTDWMLEVLQPSLVEVIAEAIVHEAIVEQHESLLAAVEKGDPARAERAMKDHLLYLRDVLRMVRERDQAEAS